MTTSFDDFVVEDVVSLDVEGYPADSWLYKPTTAGDENDWLGEYMSFDSEGKPKQDFSVLNKLKMSNIVGVPYTREVLKELSGLDKDWDAYTVSEKWIVFSRMKAKVFDRVLTAINAYDNGGDVTKKG